MFPPVRYACNIPLVFIFTVSNKQVPSVPKVSAEDTTLTTTNRAGEKIVVPIPAGANVNLHVVAMHYNCTSTALRVA